MKKEGLKKFLAIIVAVALVLTGIITLRPRKETRNVFAPVRLAEKQLILYAGHGGEDG